MIDTGALHDNIQSHRDAGQTEENRSSPQNAFYRKIRQSVHEDKHCHDKSASVQNHRMNVDDNGSCKNITGEKHDKRHGNDGIVCQKAVKTSPELPVFQKAQRQGDIQGHRTELKRSRIP